MTRLRNVQVTARANIALVKYWGKADAGRNIPDVGSLSLTLSGLETRTTVSAAEPGSGWHFELDGRPMTDKEADRMRSLFRRLDVPSAMDIHFASENHFPTAAGLASSASGGAASVVALDSALDLQLSGERLAEEALRVSGSAPRSLFPGFVRLDPAGDHVQLRSLDMPENWDLAVLVAQTATGPKKVSSRQAMASSKASPYYPAWVDSHAQDLDDAEAAIAAADFDRLVAAMERSTLKMHALPITSQPPVWYWNDVTLAVIAAIEEGRDRGMSGGYTMDAGPHVKLFCQLGDAKAWGALLAAVPGVTGVIQASTGDGPEVEFI